MRSVIAWICLALAFQQTDSLRVDVLLQQVVVTVRDEAGNIVRGLNKEDFVVEEGGVRQTIAHFSDDPNAPISLGILIDVTGSMDSMPGGAETGVRAAAGITRVLLHRLKPEDEVVLMTFSQRVAVRQTFTTDHLRMEAALSNLQPESGIRVIGKTLNPLTALPAAFEQVKKSRYSKRALIILTDAYFSDDVEKARKEIQRAEVPIFTFAMRGVDIPPRVQPCAVACHQFELVPPAILSPRGGMLGGMLNVTQSFLAALARESGGRSSIFQVDLRNTMQRINAAIDEIAAELRGQYVLGYYSSDASAKNRAIRVRTTSSSHIIRVRREDQRLNRP